MLRRKSNENRQFSHPLYLTPPMKGLPLEFGIGIRGSKCLNDGPTRWSKKFSDRFSRFDTIPALTYSQPASQPASHVAIAITLYAIAPSPKRQNVPYVQRIVGGVLIYLATPLKPLCL